MQKLCKNGSLDDDNVYKIFDPKNLEYCKIRLILWLFRYEVPMSVQLHTDPESNRLVQKVQKSKSLLRKIALITFVEDFLEHKKLIFFIA